jgi:hypothetical protein
MMKNSTFSAQQNKANPAPIPASPSTSERGLAAAKFDSLSRVRLSKNFILRDFLFCAESCAKGLSNFPQNPTLVIAAGQALCERVLEPVLAHFGRFAITYGYHSQESTDIPLTRTGTTTRPNSSPHHWDRQTFGEQVYARVDILPFCIEDGAVTKHEFGHWLMHKLDVDLLMTWTRSNVQCISISPLPRRCWLEWGRPAMGEVRQKFFMGTDYWQRVYPTLPTEQCPAFAPSMTAGSLQWRAAP